MEAPSAVPEVAEGLGMPQLALLDFFFPGFSLFSNAVQKYLHIDLSLYIHLLLLFGGLTFLWRYFSDYIWDQLESYFMSCVDIRPDDEIYNMIMGWIAAQSFAQRSRRFVVNTNLNSRSWFLWRSFDEEEEEDEYEEDGRTEKKDKKKKALSYTPTFGSHYFWYKGRLLIFRRTQNRDQGSFLVASEREEISLCCFGRDPWPLKMLIHEARAEYMKKDEARTLIYRGTTRSGSTEPTWQRCMARTSRPFSTVILNEKVKKDLIDDVTDYLNPSTRRWYSNRGIPYRRGYLLYGPPGTGKSSLSLALAGFFKMRIYIVSLSSITANEENLASLFAELPRRCVVLLEDIDTAGLTHTRDGANAAASGGDAVPDAANDGAMVPGQLTPGQGPPIALPPPPGGRLSLSGLLNILDGVASQEGRVLIMTTNHLEKLDKALIRPGRVDMIVKFDLADKGMISSIFRAIFAPLEGDDAPATAPGASEKLIDLEAEKARLAEKAAERARIVARVEALADEFATTVPDHEFSPAELQGYLLKHKRDPAAAVAGAEEWCVETRKEKANKLLKEAEEKRKKEEQEKKDQEEAAEKKKKEQQEEEEKKKEKDSKKEHDAEGKKKRRRRRNRRGRKARKDESDSESSSDSDSEDSGGESEKAKKNEKDTKAKEVVMDAPPALKREDTVKAEGVGSEVPEAIVVERTAESGKDIVEEAKHGGDSGYGTP